jgi:hypothetical protein
MSLPVSPPARRVFTTIGFRWQRTLVNHHFRRCAAAGLLTAIDERHPLQAGVQSQASSKYHRNDSQDSSLISWVTFSADCAACAVRFFSLQGRGGTVLTKTWRPPARHEASPEHRTSWSQRRPALHGMAAFGAPQGPMLKAGTRRDSALDCHAGLASRTARTLGDARRQFGR